MSDLYLTMEDVSFGYEREQEILHDVSLSAREGESIGLIGANGVGKSTFLKLLVGLNPQFSGRIVVGGLLLEKKNLPRIRSNIGYVFQDSDSQLFMNTAFEDVAFAPGNYGFPEEEVLKRTEEAMALTGISHLRNKKIYQMSGGEKKLVSIATILSMTPEMILMDEPSIALDPKNRRNLIRILNTLGQLKIIAAHDLDLVLETCERTVLLAGGRIVCDGPTGEILSDQELLEKNGLELPLCMQGFRGWRTRG